MSSITGSFSGRITKEHAIPVNDQPNHELGISEISGTHRSSDPLWHNAKLTYWGVSDILNGQGSQSGYFTSIHGDRGRDWGTFEGQVKVENGSVTLEGTWKFTGGDGEYRNVSGGGTFKTVMKSETELECNWQGSYELAKAQAR